MNSNLVLLAEVRYHDAPKRFLPEDFPWWKRDECSQFILGWAEGGYRLLDVQSTNWHAQVAKRARALVQSGVFDGVMLDWWIDDDARMALIQQVRAAIGPDALILVNANDRIIPRTAPYVNGLFMECYRSKTPEDWQRISDTCVGPKPTCARRASTVSRPGSQRPFHPRSLARLVSVLGSWPGKTNWKWTTTGRWCLGTPVLRWHCGLQSSRQPKHRGEV